jgi:hypothetical protein
LSILMLLSATWRKRGHDAHSWAEGCMTTGICSHSEARVKITTGASRPAGFFFLWCLVRPFHWWGAHIDFLTLVGGQGQQQASRHKPRASAHVLSMCLLQSPSSLCHRPSLHSHLQRPVPANALSTHSTVPWHPMSTRRFALASFLIRRRIRIRNRKATRAR